MTKNTSDWADVCLSNFVIFLAAGITLGYSPKTLLDALPEGVREKLPSEVLEDPRKVYIRKWSLFSQVLAIIFGWLKYKPLQKLVVDPRVKRIL